MPLVLLFVDDFLPNGKSRRFRFFVASSDDDEDWLSMSLSEDNLLSVMELY